MVRKKSTKTKKASRKPKKQTVKKKNTTKKKSAAKKKKVKKTKKAKKKVLTIPRGYHSITPYLIIDDAADAINFYRNVFGAKEVMRMIQPDGKIAHAELKIGDAKIMLADVCPEMASQSPRSLGGTPVGIHLYIKNVDDIVDKALSAGATLIRPVETMFYGDRSGGIEDPFGHSWYVSTHVEDVTLATIKKRAAEMFHKK